MIIVSKLSPYNLTIEYYILTIFEQDTLTSTTSRWMYDSWKVDNKENSSGSVRMASQDTI